MLRLYDRDLLSFTLAEQGLEGLKAKLLWVNEEQKHLLPLDMERSDAGVLKWLQKRVIPRNRAYVAEILKTFGLSINDTKGIIDLDNYAKTRGTPYGIRFETVCREVMGPVQTGQLRKLIGFTFQRHPRLNLPDDRLRAMERHLQKRVRQLLEPTPEPRMPSARKPTEPERA